jgi:hypothetical protein
MVMTGTFREDYNFVTPAERQGPTAAVFQEFLSGSERLSLVQVLDFFWPYQGLTDLTLSSPCQNPWSAGVSREKAGGYLRFC